MEKRRYFSCLDALRGRFPRTSESQIFRAARSVKPANRERALQLVERGLAMLQSGRSTPSEVWKASRERRVRTWRVRSAEALAQAAGYRSDEHGAWARGDHITVRGLDFVPPYLAASAPYFAQAGAGLGLVNVERKRVYAHSCSWYPSFANTVFLVGRNEAGTYFAHPVPNRIRTVRDAISWIWSGMEDQIVQRQGDIALARARGTKIPTLPPGHRLDGDRIVHATHEPLRLPGVGERIIVARRAATLAARATRD